VDTHGNVVLASDIKACFLSRDLESRSEEFCIEGANITGHVNLTKYSTKESADLVYRSALSLIDPYQYLYTKVVTILPMFVMINKTNHKLLVTQEFMEDDFIMIDSNSRENFRWPNGKGEK
jgi:hypothetical protein